MLKVSVSGSGIWGESLTHEVAMNYVKSFAAFLGPQKKIALGTDTRTTRNILKNLIISILESYGYEILDLGVVPTPLVLYAVKEKGLDGGVVVSASHNPACWNALKLIKKGGLFLNQGEVDTLQDLYNKKQFLSYSYQTTGKTLIYEGLFKEYLAKAEKLVDFHAIRQAGFRVAADAVNGTANSFVHPLLYFLNVEHQILFTDTEKEFERGAEPLPENLSALREAVIQFKAHVGLAYDPDADRLALVDEKGRAVGEDWTLAIACLNLLEKKKTSIAVNLSTSMIIDRIALQAGVSVYKSKVGEIHVTETMLEKGLEVGARATAG